MAKSAIYTANTSAQSVAVGGTVPLGTTIRRFGCNLMQAGDGITMTGSGYYKVSASATVEGSAAGTITLSVYKDGVAVPGATASVTGAADTIYDIALNSLIRLQCCNASSTLTIVLTGTAASVNNMALVVEKV